MVTLFGRAAIDLREAHTSAEQLEFSCLSISANITFLAPEGAEVRPSGIASLGSSKSTVPVSDTACHLPPMSVDSTTIFGRIRIRTTDLDPEDGEKVSFWSRFRRERSKTVAVSQEPAQPLGVDLNDTKVAKDQAPTPTQFPATLPDAPATGMEDVDNAAPARSAFVGSEPLRLPDGTLSDRPAAFGDELDDDPVDLGALTTAESADLSAPIGLRAQIGNWG